MVAFWHNWSAHWRSGSYARRAPLVLVNGLAEQPESWYRNLPAWQRHFEVHTPALLTYEGDVLQRRIDAGEPITVDFLVEQLRVYLDTFVQRPSVHLLANSMGGKVAVEFAVRYPDRVDKLVLLCPSGLAAEERLPIVEGVRRNDVRSLVDSVFYDARHADRRLLKYYQSRFTNKRWRVGMLRTIRGTMDHSVRDRLAAVTQPTLLVVGREDRIVDPVQSIAAGRRLPHGRIVELPRCGHAPQIERARQINRLVVKFLQGAR